MYMPGLGTTLRRNRLALVRVAAGLMLAVGVAAAQTTPPAQTTPSAQTPGGSQAGKSGTVPAQQAPATTQPQQPSAGQQPAPGSAQPTQQTPPANQSAPGGQPANNQDQGQAPVGNENGGFVFHSETHEVTLHATIIDDRNHLVTNLDKADFTVFENDRPQTIKFFRQQDFPVAIGIVIDDSGSMREKRDAVNKAAINLVKASNPEDQVFVVNFNDEYYLDQDFTSDVKKLQAALEHVEARGGTALYDAIVASADELMKSNLQRKALFVVTDGEDDASQESLEQAIQHLQKENGPVVYTIGLLGEEKSRKAKRALELIAERTGGIAFFPPTLSEVDEISRDIAHDIRNQY